MGIEKGKEKRKMGKKIDADALVKILEAKANMANLEYKKIINSVIRMIEKLPDERKMENES